MALSLFGEGFQPGIK